LYSLSVVDDFPIRGHEPQRRINAQLFPPCRFVTTPVNLSMIAATPGDGELIADFAAKHTGLGKSQMVGIRGPSAVIFMEKP